MYFFAVHTNDALAFLGDFQSPLEATPYAQSESIVLLVSIDTLKKWLDIFCETRATVDGYFGIKPNNDFVFLGEYPNHQLAEEYITNPTLGHITGIPKEDMDNVAWVVWAKNLPAWCDQVNRVVGKEIYRF